MEAISVKNLSVAYENNTIIEDLSLSIPKGKISIIIGANGCGKSTIIKEIANYCLCGELTVCDGFTNPYHIEPIYLNGSIFDEDKSTKYTLDNYRESLSQNGIRNDVSVVCIYVPSINS